MEEGSVEERELKIGLWSGSYCFDVLCAVCAIGEGKGLKVT